MKKIILTQKNPKSNSSLFNNTLVEVIKKGETEPFAYIVNATRKSYNRYGGENEWEVLYITILDNNIDLLPLDEDSQYLRDIQLYLPELDLHKFPCTYFHMGARDGEEPRYVFFDSKDFCLIDFRFHAIKSSHSSFKKAMEAGVFLNLQWDGEIQPIVEKDIYIDEKVIVFRTESAIHYISEDFDNWISNEKDMKDFDIEVLKRDFVKFLERTEAPAEEDIEPRPKRQRRHKPEGEYPLACN